ncbi:O-antigen ligase domain-containing protein, partial [Methylobacterium sp. WL103]
GLTIAVGLAAGLPLQRALGQRMAEFVYNRPALTLAVVAGPLALVLWRQGPRVVALAALAFAALGILRSVSGAAAMGLAAGLAMFVLGRLLPARLAVGLAGLGLGLAVALAPVEGDLLDRFMPEAAHERLVHSSSRARVAIARSFGAAVAADPWVGAGFGTSARFAEAPVAARLDPEMRTLLAVGHPHNAFLQVWAELGTAGAVLAAAVLMLMLAPLVAWPAGERATALALV